MSPCTPTPQSLLSQASENAGKLELWEQELASFREDDRSDLISHL